MINTSTMAFLVIGLSIITIICMSLYFADKKVNSKNPVSQYVKSRR